MIPGEKSIYRIFNADGQPLVDLITRKGEPKPLPGERLLSRHPFQVRRVTSGQPSVWTLT